ncbi:selenocysteine-specific translation elongation factor [Candidatus Uabimicrobium amorphum]|uniref:Selenocysteine-specific elongation factor n=1 Tax=Uabimicrobium amorphum TaxID=2596890 RepID=A0A5S9IMC2_UABAM|nr:selenocysteine-specific translation elongation factor [Candidatus Uabimicrobium amorphum]BBM83690.1 selenocysteine-specific translation factor [Candidatus Uabimicrobium amorphum]
MDIFNVIIGTAGHIDHGKSSIVRKLTGINPDRLKEEKERGLTIDLGFAPLALPNGKKVGIIDVPGHEKFIKNMVAGATGIDYVVLVIAADDGVMPQTQEHLEIMELLGIKKGLVAISKVDLVDEELLMLVEEDIREFLQDSFLQEAPICKISATSGSGWDEFCEILFREVQNLTPRSLEGIFRMPIQRVFTSHGHGTVATGIPMAGSVAIGDEVEILPQGILTKVKKIHAYGQDIKTANAGHSTALNLKDVNYQQIKRGNVVSVPGYLKSVPFIEGKFWYSKNHKRHLQHMTPIRFHCGTAEIMGHVSVLGQASLAPGEQGFIQVRLEENVVVAPGDPFILRLSSPMITIGGGVVIDAGHKKLKPFRAQISALQNKSSSIQSDIALVEMRFKEGRICRADEIRKKCLLEEVSFQKIIEELRDKEVIVAVSANPQRYIHGEILAERCTEILDVIRQYLKKNKFKLYMSILDLRNLSKTDSVELDFCLQKMPEVKVEKNKISLKSHQVKLKPAEEEYVNNVEDKFASALFSPPSKKDVLESSQLKNREALVEFLVEKNVLVPITHEIYFHISAIEKAENFIRETIAQNGELISADFRDQIKTSRKFAIPLLDYFDKVGLTVRKDNSRVLKK